MRDLINLTEAMTRPVYLRFGDIPESERSRIGRSPNYIAAMYRTGDFEEGVSCYATQWDAEEKRWVVEDVGNAASFSELSYLASEGHRPVYLIIGDEQPEPGIDGEPLLRNVKIVKQIAIRDVIAPGIFDGRELELVSFFSAKTLIMVYPDGTTKEEIDATITWPQIDYLLGWTASFNGCPGTYRGRKALFLRNFHEGRPINSHASEIGKADFNLSDRFVATGNAMILIDPVSGQKYE